MIKEKVHSVEKKDKKEIKAFLKKRAINWIGSKEDLDTIIVNKTLEKISGCQLRSSGHIVHENTSSSCIDSVFEFFEKNLKKFNKDEEE
jgi:hypothetical protein